MTDVKRSRKTECIKIRCTPDEKESIQRGADLAGADSVSEYALTLLLGGNSEKYGFMRHKADGPLLNAAVYGRLGEMVERLQEEPGDAVKLASEAMILETIELMHEIRRDIAINRLRHSFEQNQ